MGLVADLQLSGAFDRSESLVGVHMPRLSMGRRSISYISIPPSVTNAVAATIKYVGATITNNGNTPFIGTVLLAVNTLSSAWIPGSSYPGATIAPRAVPAGMVGVPANVSAVPITVNPGQTVNIPQLNVFVLDTDPPGNIGAVISVINATGSIVAGASVANVGSVQAPPTGLSKLSVSGVQIRNAQGVLFRTNGPLIVSNRTWNGAGNISGDLAVVDAATKPLSAGGWATKPANMLGVWCTTANINDTSANGFFTYCDALVNLAQLNNFYLNIIWFSSSGQSSHPPTIDAAGITAFGKVAQRYAGIPNVIFTTQSEPVTNDWALLKSAQESTIDTLRGFYPGVMCLVSGTSWSQTFTGMLSTPVNRSNIVVQPHAYYASWGQGWTQPVQLVNALRLPELALRWPVIVAEYGSSEGLAFAQYCMGLGYGLLAWNMSNAGNPIMLTSMSASARNAWGLAFTQILEAQPVGVARSARGGGVLVAARPRMPHQMRYGTLVHVP